MSRAHLRQETKGLRCKQRALVLSGYMNRPNTVRILSRRTRLLKKQDGNALGLNVICIDEYADLPKMLENIAAARLNVAEVYGRSINHFLALSKQIVILQPRCFLLQNRAAMNRPVI